MVTHSYLEYFLTLLGWVVNNGIWTLITSTGLFMLPLLLKVAAIWLRARSQGADEGNQGGLTLTWAEHLMYTALVVIMFTCVPLINIDLDTIKFDSFRAGQCGYIVTQPAQSGYQSLSNELSGKTAAVPVWWYLVHVLAKGMTNAASSTIPCQPDIRQIRFEVQHTRMTDPVLGQELQDFVTECYGPSRARLKLRGIAVSEAESQDLAWIGSRYFLTSPGFYDTDRARTPRAAWPYNNSRDSGLPDTGNGGYPTCKQWWSDNRVGIKDRVLKRVQPTLWEQIKRLGQSKAGYEEAIVRSLVSPRNLEVSQGGRVYSGFGGTIDGTILHGINRAASTAGNAIGSVLLFPALDSMRQALPMVQALLEAALIICIPLIILISAYDLKTVITLSFVQFALIFLTFWWDLARWLDSWLLSTLYNSSAHSRWNLAGIQNAQDDLILNIVMGTMFLVLPAFWVSALGWAGVKIGSMLEGAMRSGTNDAKDSGKRGGEIVLKGAETVIKATTKK